MVLILIRLQILIQLLTAAESKRQRQEKLIFLYLALSQFIREDQRMKKELIIFNGCGLARVGHVIISL